MCVFFSIPLLLPCWPLALCYLDYFNYLLPGLWGSILFFILPQNNLSILRLIIHSPLKPLSKVVQSYGSKTNKTNLLCKNSSYWLALGRKLWLLTVGRQYRQHVLFSDPGGNYVSMTDRWQFIELYKNDVGTFLYICFSSITKLIK